MILVGSTRPACDFDANERLTDFVPVNITDKPDKMSATSMSFADFRRIRQELGFAQVDVAEVLGLTERQVARFESGAAAISKPIAILMWLMLLYRTDREDEAIDMIGGVIYGNLRL